MTDDPVPPSTIDDPEWPTGPRRPWEADCRGPTCRKRIWLVVVEWRWPKRGPPVPRPVWHPFDPIPDMGTGRTVPGGVSHYRTCPDADKFGGPDRARALPPEPVLPPPKPYNPQRSLF